MLLIHSDPSIKLFNYATFPDWCLVSRMYFSLSLTALVSVLGGCLTYSIIPKFRDMFIKVQHLVNRKV